jgi:SPOR domain
LSVPSDFQIPQSSYRNIRRAGGIDPALRRMVLIAGGVGGAFLLIGGAWMTIGHHRGGVPLVMADTRPIRVKPVNPGGMQVVGAGEDVMTGGAGDGGDKVAAGPETPQIQALQAEIQAAKTADATPAPAAPDTATASTLPAAPTAVTPAAPPATGHPMVAAAPAAAPPATKASGAQVQLAALASDTAAQAEWQRLSKQLPALLTGRQPAVQRAVVDGKTVYRLRTGGFATMAAATEFCAQVRAKGAGCSIASF